MDRSTAPIQVVIDAADPASLATFWAAVLAPRGYAVPDREVREARDGATGPVSTGPCASG